MLINENFNRRKFNLPFLQKSDTQCAKEWKYERNCTLKKIYPNRIYAHVALVNTTLMESQIYMHSWHWQIPIRLRHNDINEYQAILPSGIKRVNWWCHAQKVCHRMVVMDLESGIYICYIYTFLWLLSVLAC